MVVEMLACCNDFIICNIKDEANVDYYIVFVYVPLIFNLDL